MPAGPARQDRATGRRVQMRVVDAVRADGPTGQVRQIAIRGANVMKGYWQRDEVEGGEDGLSSQGPPADLAKLVAEAERRLPELETVVIDQILATMPVYRKDTLVPPEDLEASVRRNLQAMVRAISDPDSADLTTARETGRRRAEQGAPIPEVLRAFRIGFTEVWNVLVEEADRAGPDMVKSLITAATSLWYLVDDYAEAMTEAYRDTTAALMLRRQQERAALVEALFSGARVAQPVLWEIASFLQVPIDGVFVVVAAETPALGKQALPEIESRLDAVQLSSAWRLTPELQVGVVSLRADAAQARVLGLLRDHAGGRVGVSPTFGGLDNTPRALHFARVALASQPPGQPGVFQFDDSPLTAIVASAPEEATQLAQQVLGPLLRLADDGAVLLETLSVWFDCGGSTKDSAERLYCHPNTVRYRLRRLQDELDRSLTHPADLAELFAALRALRAFPSGVPLPAPESEPTSTEGTSP